MHKLSGFEMFDDGNWRRRVLRCAFLSGNFVTVKQRMQHSCYRFRCTAVTINVAVWFPFAQLGVMDGGEGSRYPFERYGWYPIAR